MVRVLRQLVYLYCLFLQIGTWQRVSLQTRWAARCLPVAPCTDCMLMSFVPYSLHGAFLKAMPGTKFGFYRVSGTNEVLAALEEYLQH